MITGSIGHGNECDIKKGQVAFLEIRGQWLTVRFLEDVKAKSDRYHMAIFSKDCVTLEPGEWSEDWSPIEIIPEPDTKFYCTRLNKVSHPCHDKYMIMAPQRPNVPVYKRYNDTEEKRGSRLTMLLFQGKSELKWGSGDNIMTSVPFSREVEDGDVFTFELGGKAVTCTVNEDCSITVKERAVLVKSKRTVKLQPGQSYTTSGMARFVIEESLSLKIPKIRLLSDGMMDCVRDNPQGEFEPTMTTVNDKETEEEIVPVVYISVPRQ